MQAVLSRAATMAALQSLLVAGVATGQSPWLGPVAGEGVSFEVVHPQLDGVDVTTTTASYFLSLRLPVGHGLRVVGEVPYSHVGFERTSELQDPPEGGGMIGNPYLGVEWQPDAIFSVEAGIRLPLAESHSWRYAAMWADVNRMDAFNDVFSLASRGVVRWAVPDTHWRLRAEAGPGLWYESDSDDADLMIGYATQLWYEAERVNAAAGLTGIVRQTGEGDMGERSWHQLGIAANLLVGPVRPGLVLRFPVGSNMRDVLDYAIGLQVNVPGGF